MELAGQRERSVKCGRKKVTWQGVTEGHQAPDIFAVSSSTIFLEIKKVAVFPPFDVSGCLRLCFSPHIPKTLYF